MSYTDIWSPYIKGSIDLKEQPWAYAQQWAKPSTWNGEQTNEIVTIYDDLGYGDFILFARYLPLVKERCPNVQVAVKDSLLSLLRDSFRDISFISYGTAIEGKVCPITDLGYIFYPDIPTKTYLIANKIEKTASVGLCWKTDNVNVYECAHRCIPENIAQSLFEIPNSISLQYEDLKKNSTFAKTAAIINTLDLIITIDTSVAHLAGALGKPTWLLLPQNVAWIWNHKGTISPWYPSMELIRQNTADDWQEVVDRVIKKYKKEII